MRLIKAVPLSLCSSVFVLRPCILQHSVDSIVGDASNCMMLDQLSLFLVSILDAVVQQFNSSL